MKQKILEKAGEMFLNLGFKSITMDDISSELGISKKTVYNHYKTKTDLVKAVTFSLFELICNGIDDICNTSNNPIEELYDIKKYVMVHLKNEKSSPQYQLKKYYPKIFDEVRIKQYEKMHETVEKSLMRGIEMELFRPTIDVNFITRIYFNGMNGIKDEEIFPRDKFSPLFLIENYLEYHLRAIVTEKGLSVLKQFIKSNKAT